MDEAESDFQKLLYYFCSSCYHFIHSFVMQLDISCKRFEQQMKIKVRNQVSYCFDC